MKGLEPPRCPPSKGDSLPISSHPDVVKTCEVYCWTSTAHLPVRESNSSGWGLEPRFTFAPTHSAAYARSWCAREESNFQ